MPALPGWLISAFSADGLQELVEVPVLALAGHPDRATAQNQATKVASQVQASTLSGT